MTRQCSFCGEELEKKDIYCFNCGKSQETAEKKIENTSELIETTTGIWFKNPFFDGFFFGLGFILAMFLVYLILFLILGISFSKMIGLN